MPNLSLLLETNPFLPWAPANNDLLSLVMLCHHGGNLYFSETQTQQMFPVCMH